MRSRVIALMGLVALVSATTGAGLAMAAPRAKPPVIQDGPVVEVQILALNDFHGNLEPPAGSSGRVGVRHVAGGAEYLATHIENLEQANREHDRRVAPATSSGPARSCRPLFHDEPTIEAMNQIGLDLNAVGNHEFDEGATELLRMQNGGCHPVDGCRDGNGFAGADFRFLAANVVNDSDR